MADLLSANPSGAARRLTKDHQPARGTLLHTSEQERAKNRASILQTNMRSSSYAHAPPADQRRPYTSRTASGFGMLQQQQHQQQGMMPPAAGFTGYNTMGMPTSTSTPMFAGANSYFPSPTAGFQQPGMPMNMMMPGYPQHMQMQHNPYQAYGQQMGYGMPMNMNMGMTMPMNSGMGMGGMPMAAGAGYEEGISPQQRDNIDRWRMSVAPAPQ